MTEIVHYPGAFRPADEAPSGLNAGSATGGAV